MLFRSMPRHLSRITLEITDVRAERVQDISDADARAEGVMLPARTTTLYHGQYADAFAGLWDSINAKRGFGFGSDPLVWVLGWRTL